MEKRNKSLKARLAEAASTGLDMSPGDPLCAEALDYILELEDQLNECDANHH